MGKSLSTPLMVIRAEASTTIGTGHVMRMLALAQAWQDIGGRVFFLFAQPNRPMRLRLEEANCQVVEFAVPSASLADAEAVANFVSTKHAEWIAVDGYDFNENYLATIKRVGIPICLTSDYPQPGQQLVNAVLNQNPFARAEDYSGRTRDTHLFLGLGYALLRRDFRQWSDKRMVRSGKISRIIVTLGGSDADNITERVVRELTEGLPESVRVTIVIGGNNPHGSAIRAVAARRKAQFDCLEHVSDMAGLFSQCDLAVSAAGSTCWEMAFMGVPMLAIVLAKNQLSIAEALESLDCGINLGWHHHLKQGVITGVLKELLDNPGRVGALASRGQILVDGMGASRVVAGLRTGIN